MSESPEKIYNNEDDEIIFAEENQEETPQIEQKIWKVMIVDDDEDIHFLTKLVLRDFSFENRTLSFISAYSGREAKEMIAENPDTALIILDVIMEDMNAGLDVIKYIRNELKNNLVRIILRTGQPGQEPEYKVVIQYDIDDYKTKTELSSQKLFTSIVSALRSYRNLRLIEKYREGAQLVLDSFSKDGKNFRDVNILKGILIHLAVLSGFDGSAAFGTRKPDTSVLEIVSATGIFEEFTGKDSRDCLSERIHDSLAKTEIERKSIVEGSNYFSWHKNEFGDYFLILNGVKSPSNSEIKLISRFTRMLSYIYFEKHVQYRNIDFQVAESG